jgi:fumarate hydratase subunit alpha
MPFTVDEVKNAVSETLVKASTSFSADQIARYKDAIEKESNDRARWVLELTLKNAETGEKNRLPLCDDTGIPHLFVEIGDDAVLPAGFFRALNEGVAQGLRQLPGRPMAVKGDGADRVTQSKGLFEDPGALEAAPTQIRTIPGDKVKITVLMLGGGPEIRGKTFRVFHQHSMDVVIREMISWAAEGIAKLGCTPSVLAFGIGRTHVEASSMMLEALKEANFDKQDEIETRITSELNKEEVGALGLGGDTSVLGTFIKIGPLRASGIRVVSLRTGCCFDPRRATVSIG